MPSKYVLKTNISVFLLLRRRKKASNFVRRYTYLKLTNDE